MLRDRWSIHGRGIYHHTRVLEYLKFHYRQLLQAEYFLEIISIDPRVDTVNRTGIFSSANGSKVRTALCHLEKKYQNGDTITLLTKGSALSVITGMFPQLYSFCLTSFGELAAKIYLFTEQMYSQHIPENNDLSVNSSRSLN